MRDPVDHTAIELVRGLNGQLVALADYEEAIVVVIWRQLIRHCNLGPLLFASTRFE